MTGDPRVPSSIPENRVSAKLTVEAQLVIAENTISVGHCVIPSSKGLVPHCSVVMRSILATHAFDLVGIKRSWHCTEGGSVIVGVKRVSATYRQPTCTV